MITTRLSNTCTGWNQIRVYRDGACIGWVNVGVFCYAYRQEDWDKYPSLCETMESAIAYIKA